MEETKGKQGLINFHPHLDTTPPVSMKPRGWCYIHRKHNRRCLARAGEKRPAVKDVLRALAEPSLRLCFEHPHFARLLSRLRYDQDDSLWPAYRAAQAECTKSFREAFAAALSGLPAGEVRTRVHYVLGAIQQVWSHCPRPAGETPEGLLDSFLTFYSAGLSAPAPGTLRSTRTARQR